MAEIDELVQELRGRMMVNELLTFTMLAVLTQHAPNREKLIHDLVVGMEGTLANVPEETVEDKRRKAWALAYWRNVAPMFGTLAMIDADGRKRQ